MSVDQWNWGAFAHRSIRHKKGAHLFRQGQPVENMFLLVSGRVKLTRFAADGNAVILHIAEAGELIAEPSLFSESYHCTAMIDRDAELLEIRRSTILSELETSRDSTLALLRHMCGQVRELRGLLEIRNIRSARERIYAYLNSIADPGGQVSLATSRRDIAYKLGLAPETVYREFNKLMDEQRIQQQDEKTLIISG